MTILRVPPYPLYTTIVVPGSNEDYMVYIEDSAGDLLIDGEYTSNSNYEIVVQLPEDAQLYDETYIVSVYESVSGQNGDKVVEDRLEIVRPYTTVTGDTASELAQNQAYEELARAVIDSITGGFYYKKIVLQTTGLGNDYIPVWYKPYKILTVIENNRITYDHVDHPEGLDGYTFHITDDKTAFTRHIVGEYDRNESSPLFLPEATSDILDIYGRGGVMFPVGYDYVFVYEGGYKVVPSDIKKATDLLIEDIKCGKLDYYKRYVKSYSTDQFKLDYDPRMMDRTGNLIVDKILEKYIPAIHKFGVL